jgi:hypothetical protein
MNHTNLFVHPLEMQRSVRAKESLLQMRASQEKNPAMYEYMLILLSVARLTA